MASRAGWLDPQVLARSLATGAADRLATYGSLRPGGQHHELVSDLELIGVGVVRGDLSEWEGYPVLRLRAEGEVVPVVVLGGIGEARWAELDAFEGPAYRRDLIVVELGGGKALVASGYVAAKA